MAHLILEEIQEIRTHVLIIFAWNYLNLISAINPIFIYFCFYLYGASCLLREPSFPPWRLPFPPLPFPLILRAVAALRTCPILIYFTHSHPLIKTFDRNLVFFLSSIGNENYFTNVILLHNARITSSNNCGMMKVFYFKMW